MKGGLRGSLFNVGGMATFYAASRDLPRCGGSSVVKTKISVSLQLFCDYGLFSLPCKAGMGAFAADFLLFCAQIRDQGPGSNP